MTIFDALRAIAARVTFSTEAEHLDVRAAIADWEATVNGGTAVAAEDSAVTDTPAA